MKNLRAARRYATALLKATEERGTLDRAASDLEVVEKVLKGSRDFALFVASPVIPAARKSTIFKELLGKSVGEDVMTFFLLLTQKGREELIPEIIDQFRLLHTEKLGIVDVRVTAAVELPGEQRKELERKLEKYTSRTVRMQTVIDGGVKGGLVIQIGDTVLDGSVRHQLELMRDRLLSGPTLS